MFQITKTVKTDPYTKAIPSQKRKYGLSSGLFFFGEIHYDRFEVIFAVFQIVFDTIIKISKIHIQKFLTDIAALTQKYLRRDEFKLSLKNTTISSCRFCLSRT